MNKPLLLLNKTKRDPDAVADSNTENFQYFRIIAYRRQFLRILYVKKSNNQCFQAVIEYLEWKDTVNVSSVVVEEISYVFLQKKVWNLTEFD